MVLEKRELAENFRLRLREVMARNPGSASDFARRCGIDRSALSQFLDERSPRLPRSETLVAIAKSEEISVDWLLGLSQDEGALGEVKSGATLELAPSGTDNSLIEKWHDEAAGYKIRYSPSSLPDLLRTPAVIHYEFGRHIEVPEDAKADFSQKQLNYSRLPETDMEVVMPLQRLIDLAGGTGIWSDLERGKRQAQLLHMARLLEELYPTFRLFLYDGRSHFLAPFTVFGPKRAAVYLGDMYMVINSVDHIRQLTQRFDRSIRASVIAPDRVVDWIGGLSV